jgi:hypothetical protein
MDDLKILPPNLTELHAKRSDHIGTDEWLEKGIRHLTSSLVSLNLGQQGTYLPLAASATDVSTLVLPKEKGKLKQYFGTIAIFTAYDLLSPLTLVPLFNSLCELNFKCHGDQRDLEDIMLLLPPSLTNLTLRLEAEEKKDKKGQHWNKLQLPSSIVNLSVHGLHTNVAPSPMISQNHVSRSTQNLKSVSLHNVKFQNVMQLVLFFSTALLECPPLINSLTITADEKMMKETYKYYPHIPLPTFEHVTDLHLSGFYLHRVARDIFPRLKNLTLT